MYFSNIGASHGHSSRPRSPDERHLRHDHLVHSLERDHSRLLGHQRNDTCKGRARRCGSEIAGKCAHRRRHRGGVERQCRDRGCHLQDRRRRSCARPRDQGRRAQPRSSRSGRIDRVHVPIRGDDLHVHRVHDRRRDPLGQRLVDGRHDHLYEPHPRCHIERERACRGHVRTRLLHGQDRRQRPHHGRCGRRDYVHLELDAEGEPDYFSETALTGGSLDVSATVTTSTSADEDEKSYSAAATVSLP